MYNLWFCGHRELRSALNTDGENKVLVTAAIVKYINTRAGAHWAWEETSKSVLTRH